MPHSTKSQKNKITITINDELERYPLMNRDTSLVSASPINYLGDLRKLLKDFPDDTVIANGIVALNDDEKDSKKRAHRIITVRKGQLKNGKGYVCFMSGTDITSKIWSVGLEIKE